MKQRTRIPRKRSKPRVIHPERTGGHKRVRLYGAAKTQRRRELFKRSGGRCEEMVPVADTVLDLLDLRGCDLQARCYRPITWETMEWSHNRHAANKCDCMQCGIASCQECHRKRHNAGGKPVPKKLGSFTSFTATANDAQK